MSHRRHFLAGTSASLLALGFAPEQPNGALSVRVTTLKPRRRRRPRRTHEDVVVYLEGVPGRMPDTRNEVHEIRQVDQEFVPRVSVVLVGTTLSFPNDDRIFHNVWTKGAVKRDLGTYKSGATNTFEATRPGTVEVFCNIHPNMEAKVLILDTPFFGMSDTDGYIWIGKLPPGKYKYHAWQAWGEAKSGKVTINPAETTKLALDLVTERPERHQRKDGSDYPRRY